MWKRRWKSPAPWKAAASRCFRMQCTPACGPGRTWSSSPGALQFALCSAPRVASFASPTGRCTFRSLLLRVCQVRAPGRQVTQCGSCSHSGWSGQGSPGATWHSTALFMSSRASIWEHRCHVDAPLPTMVPKLTCLSRQTIPSPRSSGHCIPLSSRTMTTWRTSILPRKALHSYGIMPVAAGCLSNRKKPHALRSPPSLRCSTCQQCWRLTGATAT